MRNKENDCRECENCMISKDGTLHCVMWYRHKDDEIEIKKTIVNPIGICEDYCEVNK